MDMISSPEDASDIEVSTPLHQTAAANTAVLSPPDSSRAMPTVASGTSIANSNGKRPLQTISNGEDDDVLELKAMNNGKAKADVSIKTHASSGYTYSKAEDEPGYAWLNKKAQDEYGRAWEGLQHKDCMVKNRYGDPFEAAAKEKATIASLEQQ